MSELDNYLTEEITAESIEIFSYGMYVQKQGFGSEFVKAEKWTWEVVSKEQDEPSPQMELDFNEQIVETDTKKQEVASSRFKF